MHADDTLASNVAESVGIVMRRKEMLEEGMISLGRREPLSARKNKIITLLGPSDIRDVIRELRIIE